MSVPDTDELVEAYFEHADWEHERERAENTSEAVRTLAEALVETREEIGSEELTVLYNLVQHENTFGREEKREAVEQFDLDDETRDRIFTCFDGPIGIVGSGTNTVNVDGGEEAVTEFLRDFVRAASTEGRIEAVEKFARRDVSGVQAGIVSPIVYAMAPEEFPIANSPAREGMEKYFGRGVSSQLSGYVRPGDGSRVHPSSSYESFISEIESDERYGDSTEFHFVRKDYDFDDNYRHLDYFFQWAPENPTGDPADPVVPDVTRERADTYWVTQSNEHEFENGYLRAKHDGRATHRATRLAEGDLIFHNFDGEICAVSQATGNLRITQDDGTDYEIARVRTHRLDTPVSKDEILAALDHEPFRPDKHYPVNSNGNLNQGYLFELSRPAANWLLAELGVEDPDWETFEWPPSGVDTDGTDPNGSTDDDATDTISIPDSPPARHEEIARQLDATGQVVLTGPPGTGKTHTATTFARWWVDDRTDEPTEEQVRTVTFHPAFAYEDFLEGLTATTVDDDGNEPGADAEADANAGATGVTYEIEPGLLREVAEDARAAYDEAVGDDSDPSDAPPYVLVIDEINRGDLPQVLGEAITLLEPGERDRHEVSLAHSGDSFSLPPNLYLIGTMNTADQSIALVDAALRRRFRFLRVSPEPERVLALELGGDEGDVQTPSAVVTDESASDRDRLLAASVAALAALNERIRRDAARLERGQQLGHTALLGHDDACAVADAWQFELLPQLAEYYYGQTDALRRELFEDGGTDLFDWGHGVPVDLDLETLYESLCEIGGTDGDDAVPLDTSVGDGTAAGGATTGDASEATENAPVDATADDPTATRTTPDE
ncbi:McrB family protein [Halobaculum sp. MBLA0143]|uniref:McrB family protein n=1 Tax=Halobaculum sp. MBLA0143 TaxID=3079933 RepID=UPI0035266A4E